MLFNQHSGLSSILVMHAVPSCWALGMHVHCCRCRHYIHSTPTSESPGCCFSNAIVNEHSPQKNQN